MIEHELHPLLQAPAVAFVQLVLKRTESGHGAVVRGALCGGSGRHFAGGVVIVGDKIAECAQALGHHIEHGTIRHQRHILYEARNADARLAPHGSGVRRHVAAENLEQRGFSGPVAADDADAFARINLQAGVVEQRMMAVRNRDVIEGHQRHGSVFPENRSELSPEAGENSAQHLCDRPRGGAVNIAGLFGLDIPGLEVLTVSRAELGGSQVADAAKLNALHR